MNETYDIRVTVLGDDLFEAVVETPALRAIGKTFDEALLEVERALSVWRMERARRERATQVAS